MFVIAKELFIIVEKYQKCLCFNFSPFIIFFTLLPSPKSSLLGLFHHNKVYIVQKSLDAGTTLAFC
jgi:hypothetical protein